jgi:hypothetical protein
MAASAACAYIDRLHGVIAPRRNFGQVSDQAERDERLGRLVRLRGRMTADVLDNIGKVVPQASEAYITQMPSLANGAR